MTYKPLSNDTYTYFLEQAISESEALYGLRKRTLLHPYAQNMTPPEQLQFLIFLIKCLEARQVIEVGVFTGYATLGMAEALGPEGRIIACDTSSEWPLIGRPFWETAGVADKIDLCIDPALITLQNLLDEGGAGTIDFIYVDADKIHYLDYLALGRQLLSKKGIMAFDNVLRLNTEKGAVYARDSASTRALYEFNRQVRQDKSLNMSILPLGSGLTLLRPVHRVDP